MICSNPSVTKTPTWPNEISLESFNKKPELLVGTYNPYPYEVSASPCPPEHQKALKELFLAFKEYRIVALEADEGGVGLARLATEFLYRMRSYFAKNITWLNFVDPDFIPAQIVESGQRLCANFEKLPFENHHMHGCQSEHEKKRAEMRSFDHGQPVTQPDVPPARPVLSHDRENRELDPHVQRQDRSVGRKRGACKRARS